MDVSPPLENPRSKEPILQATFPFIQTNVVATAFSRRLRDCWQPMFWSSVKPKWELILLRLKRIFGVRRVSNHGPLSEKILWRVFFHCTCRPRLSLALSHYVFILFFYFVIFCVKLVFHLLFIHYLGLHFFFFFFAMMESLRWVSC